MNRSEKQKKVVIIGSGIGGLSTALQLFSKGYSPIVIEKNSFTGGKMNRKIIGDCVFDTGPSLITMPFLLEQLFQRLTNKPLSEFVTLQQIDPICRYYFNDSSHFDAYTSTEKLTEELNRFSPNSVKPFFEYLQHSKKVYDATKDVFLFNKFDGFLEFFKPKNFSLLPKLPSLKFSQNFHSFNASFFKDARLLQMFDRFATYNGSSPYLAPATLMVIPFIEFHYGGWYPMGGMYTIAEALTSLVKQFSIPLYTNEAVEKIITNNGVVSGVITEKGNHFEADYVVSNVDYHFTQKHLLKRSTKPPTDLSCSGFSMLVRVKKNNSRGLIHHNIVFSSDYKQEFQDIFEQKIVAKDMTIYIANTSFTDPSQAGADTENWFILVNAPAIDVENANQNDYADRIFQSLEQKGILQKSDVLEFEIRDHTTFQNETGSTNGALYGSSSNSMFSAFLRPKNQDKQLKNLYYVGGSTHPGGGIPLVILSSAIVTDLITT
jgi:phytoene desaturase